jgi:Ni/Fe-hydrogenase 1 B-type cytochrome subunit
MATGYPLRLTPEAAKYGRRQVWELPVRITHWVTATSITLLIITGFYITYPVGTSNGEPWHNFLMGRFREVHFISGYAMLFSFIVRGYWFFAGNKYSRSGVPLFWRKTWWKSVFEQIMEYMGKVRGPVTLGHNSLAGSSYFGIVGGVGLFQIVSGFALYGETNPGGFWDKVCGWIIPLLGGSYRTHLWHHFAAWAFIIFIILHLYIVLFDSVRYKDGLISAMFSGDKFYEEGDIDSDDWVS